MSIELDKTKKYGMCVGISGAHFKQEGEYFGVLGNLLTLSEDGKSASPAEETEDPKVLDVTEEKFVEFDVDKISGIEDFDLFHKALEEADTKHAKQAIKAFALDVVGMEKININKGLGKLVTEVRAEYRAVLEADIV